MSISNIEKRRRGRPATDATPVLVRVQPDQIEQIDKWAGKQKDAPGRPEAIRRLVEIGLGAERPAPRTSAKTAARAAELAGKAINRASDPLASPDERAVRKRKVLKGPSAFRGVRKD